MSRVRVRFAPNAGLATLALEWRTADMPEVGTVLTEGQTVTLRLGEEAVPFTVLPGMTVEFPASPSGERLVRFGGADGRIVARTSTTGVTVALRGTAPGEVSAVRTVDGTPVELDPVDLSGSSSAFFKAALLTNADAALARLQDTTPTDFDLALDLSGDGGAVAALVIGGSLAREPETAIPAKGVGMRNVTARAAPDGAVTLAISTTTPAEIILAEILDVSNLAAMLANAPAASDLLAPSGTTLASLLPAEIAVGEALSPSTPGDPGSPAQDGPNLLSDANVGSAPAGVTNRVYDEVGDGWYQFDVTSSSQLNHNIYQPPSPPPVGTVVKVTLSADSPGQANLTKLVSGVKSPVQNQMDPGQTVEYTIEAGWTQLRFDHYQTGTGFKVSVRVKDAIPAVPPSDPIPGDDVDLATAFVGGRGTRTITVEDMPAGWTATGSAISGASAASVGAGGDYTIRVTAEDEAGEELVLEHMMTVTEPFSIQSVTIVNANGSETFAVGDTAVMDIAYRGWPGPFPSAGSLYPKWSRVWRNQSDTTIGAGESIVIPSGVTELRCYGQFQTSEGVFSTQVFATPVSVSATAVTSAPEVLTPTSGSVAGRTVTIANGTAQGNPTPTAAITALTIDGVDALGDLDGQDITVAGTAAAAVAWTVTWTNSEGTATSSGSASVAEVGEDTPAAPASTAWRVSPTYDAGTQVYLAVDAVPADATAIEWRKDGGAWTATDYVAPGVFTISGGFLGGTEATVELRFVNASGAGAAASKTVTPRAKSNTQFACWADGETRHWITAVPGGVTLNAPIAVSGGGEIEVMDWSASRFADASKYRTGHIGYSAPVSPSAAGYPAEDSIFFDPLGSAKGLAPAALETRTVSATPTNLTVAIHGAAGKALRKAISLVGFGTGGLPVAFRFDRRVLGGRLPDGRPFVIGPARIVHNGGNPIEITPNGTKGYTCVSLDGAVLCVVSRAGIIPPLGASASDLKAVHGYNPAYVRRAGVYDFAADGWDETAAAAAGSTGVTLRPTFETIGVYANIAGTADCKVRFRKAGDPTFYPAHDLWYDSRNQSGYPEPYLAAKHRGVIVHLEPGTEYEVQIKQGSTYRKATVATWTHDVPRTSVSLGEIDGPVFVSKLDANTVRVTRGVLGPLDIDVSGGKWAEIHSGTIRGSVTMQESAEKVIFREVDRFGGALRSGFDVVNGASNIRILGGRSSGWGQIQAVTDKTVAVPRWGDRDGCEVELTGALASHSVVLMGRIVGSPRYPANSQQEIGDQTGDPWHPYGPCVIGRHAMQAGRLVMMDCAVWADGWRSLEDCVLPAGGNKPSPGATGGNGPDMVFIGNYFHGAMDDALELDGQAYNAVCLHNVFDQAEMRPGVRRNVAISGAYVAGGPAMIARNLIVSDPVDNRGATPSSTAIPNPNGSTALKIGGTSTSVHGRTWVYHLTSASADPDRFPRTIVAAVANNVHVRNTVARAEIVINGAWTSSLLSSTAVLRTRNQPLTGAYALDADFRPVGSELVGKGEEIPNINDGGPFYEATPSIGALRA